MSSYLPQVVKDYLEVELKRLKANYPNFALLPDVMLDNMKVDYEPEDDSSYIAVKNIGEKPNMMFTDYIYTVNIRIVGKNIDGLNMGIFSRWISSIALLLRKIEGRKIGGLYITTVESVSVNLEQYPNKAYVGEVVYKIGVDQKFIIGEIVDV